VRAKVPGLVPGEPRRLGVHAEGLVEGDGHGLRRVTPEPGLRVADAEFASPLGVLLGRVRGGQQVPARHQVAVDVVVGQGAVLVRGP